MSKYTVEFTNSTVPKTVEADDVQITAQTAKFLNGQGKAAKLVAFFPTDTIRSIEEIK